MILVVDIDGTLADNSHREGFVQGSQKDWEAFYQPELVAWDKPIVEAQLGLPRLYTACTGLYIHTGRPERLRQVTENWLFKHFNMHFAMTSNLKYAHSTSPNYASLVMRDDRDHRPAVVYKEELHLYLKEWGRESRCIIDDDRRNEELYKKYGNFLKAPEIWRAL